MQTLEGEYLDLSVDVCDKIVDLVRASRDVSPWERRARVVDQLEGRDKKAMDFDGYADDLIRDSQPVFDLRQHVFMGHRNVLKGKYGDD